MSTSNWRRHSRIVIDRVLAENPGVDEAKLFKLISAAYPFGERKYHRYKIWLSEVAATRKQRNPRQLPDCDAGDYESVLLVAGDLVELGRIEEARQLLTEQAPYRLTFGCPACGARPYKPCVVIDMGHPLLVPHAARVSAWPLLAKVGP